MRTRLDLILLLQDEESYSAFLSYLKEMIRGDFSKRRDTVTVSVNSDIVTMTYGKLLLNLFLARPFMGFEKLFDMDMLYMKDSLSQDDLEKHFNKIIKKFKESGETVDYDRLRKDIAFSLNEMSDLSGYLNVSAGTSISFQDFVRISVEDKNMHDAFYHKIRYGLSFTEIEKEFANSGKKLIEYFSTHPETELHPFVISGTGINTKQLTQCISFVGLKPDLDGSVIPVAINDNYLVGLSNLENYFINCKGTRKALYTNHKMTRKSGYLTRKLSLCNLDNYVDPELEDCKTTHFVKMVVQDAKKLNQLTGRHYYDLDESGNPVSELKTISASSLGLIGKTIGLRSPVTCAGKHVCATCYGRELSEINKDVHAGLIAVLRLTEPLTQRPLSAKHLLSTNTKEVDWGKNFKEYFTVNMNSIYMRKDIAFKIEIEHPGFEAYDEDEERFVVNEFKVIPAMGASFVYHSPTPLYIRKTYIDLSTEPGVITIESSFENDTKVFKFNANNSELTKSLQEVLDLIETSSHLGITTYDGLVNKFDDLLISNNLGYIKSVHVEMLCRPLIVDKETGKKLDFSGELINDYVINRVSKSIMSGPLSVSLAFERLNDQFVNMMTYEKTENSFMDYLFR